MGLSWCAVPTQFGTFHLVADDAALIESYLPGHDASDVSDDYPEATRGMNALLEDASKQLTDWSYGLRESFDVPLQMRGTDFQNDVWRTLTEIPFGEAWSYGDVATAMGRPGAARAVGNANNKNKHAPFVPCHRVIAADGGLGGYGGGEPLKRKMLEMEGIEISD